MNISLKHLFISSGHNYFGRYGLGSLDHKIIEKESIELVAGKGIVDDRFFGFEEDYKGQITFFDCAVYRAVQEKFSNVEFQPAAFRRNVMVEGIDLNSLIGKRFRIGELVFTGSCECSPCFWMDEAVEPGAHEFMKGRGGLRARILTDGELVLGDFEIEVLGDCEVDVSK